MQLIYLHVEKYKNIDSQGFDFGSRFNCNFDKKTNELTISENKSYIENFFYENIEITAIVGENGAGKSSLIELLTCGLVGTHPELFSDIIFVFYKGNKVYIKYNNNSNWSKVIVDSCLEYEFLDYFRNYWVNLILPNFNGYSKEVFHGLRSIYNMQGDFNRGQSFSILKLVQLISKHQNLIEKTLDKKYKFNSFDLVVSKKSKDFISGDIYKGNKLNSVIINLIGSIESIFQESVGSFCNIKPNIELKYIIEYNAFLFLLNFSIDNEEYLSKETIEFIENLGQKIKKPADVFNSLEEFNFLLKKNDEQNKEKIVYSVSSLFYCQYESILFLKASKGRFIECSEQEVVIKVKLEEIGKIGELINKTKYVSLLTIEESYCSGFVDYNFSNNNTGVSYINLSSGEKQVLKISAEFLYQLSCVEGSSKAFILFADELEEHLHPAWQKDLLSIILKLIRGFVKNTGYMHSIHLIATTHSPFLLSDIPNQNIVFLKEGKQVNAFEKKNTFGANIHTLLSNSFFMSNGLMGEFAKNKIEEVISFINSDESKIKSAEEAQEIINIIGEPVLKCEIQRMLDSKKLNKIEYIKKNIEKLEARLKELENGKN